MSEDIKMTKLASCAGCGAKVGAGMLVKLLNDLPVRHDDRLLVGYDKSDDACVYVVDDDTAIVQTLDFFPPIVDDPRLFGQIAACNALSDVYAMGAEPKLALNIMTISSAMTRDAVQEVLRGGYEKAFEADTIIAGGHTIEDLEPKYGLSVTGFVHPKRVLKNSGAKPGDALILTKPLGVGILTTAAKADLVDDATLQKLYAQMARLNRAARDSMVKYEIHSCTDVTGFSLMGHSYEMAAGSACSIHLQTDEIPYHHEAWDMADMGFVPAGAYRNRDYVEHHVKWEKPVPRPMQDILFDPQTSGGLLIAVAEQDAQTLLRELQAQMDDVKIVGYVTELKDQELIVE
ncbi:MAG: selenide, water dikinase SelD [Lachnospiraceae bacterium]|nr:selenide, water dikinase SelD [Lachnospiraceae bacterium]